MEAIKAILEYDDNGVNTSLKHPILYPNEKNHAFWRIFHSHGGRCSVRKLSSETLLFEQVCKRVLFKY